MSERPKGRYIPITPGRVFVNELMRQSRKMPLILVERNFNLKPLLMARQQQNSKISWVALFAKAYGLVGQQLPNLRWSWIRFPWSRIYEHPFSECSVIVEREFQGEMCVFATPIRNPEAETLLNLTERIQKFRDAPVEEVPGFRALLRMTKLPSLLRWFIFWMVLNWTGSKRSKRFGTFTISSLGNYGTDLLTPISPLTGYLTYGPIREDGTVTVRLIFDHRVMDGRQAARALVEMEQTMLGTLLNELHPSLTPPAN